MRFAQAARGLAAVSTLILAGATFAAGVAPAAVESRFADFNGSRVHYENVGEGPRALVFVHGWSGSVSGWRVSLQSFPGRHVIAIDLPGHGQSAAPHVDYTMDYFANGVAAVLRSARVESAVLVGHSMGARVIRQFYRLHREKTLGLIVVDGPLAGFTREEVVESVRPFLEDYRAARGKLVDALTSLKSPELAAEARETMLATPEHVALSALVTQTDGALWMRDKVDVPVLAILARAAWWKPDIEARFREVAPDLEFQMWDGVSHMLVAERPHEFNEAVTRFLSRTGLLDGTRSAHEP